MARDLRRRGRLADEQALGLDDQDDRDRDQQQPDAERADAVPHRLVRQRRQPHADEGEGEPDQRGDVLEQHQRQLGDLGVPDERGPAVGALVRARLVHGGAQRERLQADGDGQHDDGHDRRVEVVRVPDLLDALVHREQPAGREQHQRDQEGEHVPVAAVAERMLGRGPPPRRAGPDQQQALVAGVDDRVHPFGQHRGRAGDRERDELDHGDAEVGPERGQDGLRAAGRTHQCASSAGLARPGIQAEPEGQVGGGELAERGGRGEAHERFARRARRRSRTAARTRRPGCAAPTRPGGRPPRRAGSACRCGRRARDRPGCRRRR